MAARPVWRRPRPSTAFALVLLLALVAVGSGPRIGMTAQAAAGIVTRQVWVGHDAGSASADGRWLRFTDWSWGHLATRDLTAGQIRRPANKDGGWDKWHEYAESAVFSADGKQAAFQWHNRQDYGELRVAGIDGSGSRVLLRAEKPYGTISPADWSADGDYILAVHRPGGASSKISQILLVPTASGSPRVMKRKSGWCFRCGRNS